MHDQFGGNRQNGISTSARVPWIFIFSGASGKKHGYKDQWENKNVFSYTGEGQIGDMTFTRGNLALKEHLKDGKRVFLFKYVKSGYVEFASQLTFLEADYFETHDRIGDLRFGIKFFFWRTGVALDINLEELNYIAPATSNTDVLQPILQDTVVPYGFSKPTITERSGLVNSRVGQGAYRRSILHRWEYKCGVTKFDNVRILIASHIVPWRDASDEQRLDVENGILLSPTYDALFDKHLITFNKSGEIILSDIIMPTAYEKIGVTGSERLSKPSEGMLQYLDEHQKTFQLNHYSK